MILTNGCYYTMGNGEVVVVHRQRGGNFFAYNAAGEQVHEQEEKDHVNGWVAAGEQDFVKAKQAIKDAAKAASNKPKKKKKKSN